VNISHHCLSNCLLPNIITTFLGDKLKYPNYEGDQPRNSITASTIIYFWCFSFYYMNPFIKSKLPYNIVVATREFRMRGSISRSRKCIVNYNGALFLNRRNIYIYIYISSVYIRIYRVIRIISWMSGLHMYHYGTEPREEERSRKYFNSRINPIIVLQNNQLFFSHN